MAINKPVIGQKGWGTTLNAALDELDAEKLDAATASASFESLSSATQTRQQIAPGRACLLYPDHLSRWWADLAAQDHKQAKVKTFGDSIFTGLYADDAGNGSNNTIFRERGVIGALRLQHAEKLFGATIGEGAMMNEDLRVTHVGAQSIGITGPGKKGYRIDAGDTITYQLPASTIIRVHSWWEGDSVSAPWVFTLDGSGDITSINWSGNGYSRRPVVQDFTGLANTPHTLVIKGPATKYSDISYVQALNTLAGGVQIDRFNSTGGKLSSFFYDEISQGATDTLNTTIGAGGCDLAVIGFGANSVSIAGQAEGETPAGFASLLTKVCDYQTGVMGGAALICAGPRWNPSGVGPIPEADFYDAAREVAENNPHVAFFDLARHPLFASYAAANAAGLMFDDIHPRRVGHSLYARLLAESLGIR